MTAKETLERKFKLYGFERGDKPLDKDSVYKKLLTALSDKKIKISASEPIKADTIKIQAREFINANGLELVSVPIIKPLDKPDKSFDEIVSRCQYKSPFKIPVNFPEGQEIAEIKENDFVLETIPLISPNQTTVIEAINLPAQDSDLNHASYLHLLYNAIFMTTKGSIVDYHNRELLGYLLETLYAQSKEEIPAYLTRVKKRQLKKLYDSLYMLTYYQKNGSTEFFTELEAVEASVNIESILKAMKLFDMYQKNILSKKDLITIINFVVSGAPVELTLDMAGVTLENSTDPKLIKSYLK